MSFNVGGYLRGPWWRYTGDDETETRRCYVIAWGYIVMNPQETYKNMRSVKFVLKTGRGAGRAEKYLVCRAYGEQICTVIASAMEKGDIVCILGTWTESLKSKTKKGVKPTYECRANFIIPQGLVGFLMDMYSTEGIKNFIEEYKNADSDVWESD